MTNLTRHSKWIALALSLPLVLGLQSCAELLQQPLVADIKAAVDAQLPKSVAPPAQQADQPQTATLGEMEQLIHTEINKIRVKNGLKPLKDNAKLDRVARNYSRTMADKNFFSHNGPGGDTVADRVRSVGVFYRVVGENLAKLTRAPRPAQLAVEGWMKSPGHRENILRPVFTESGIGAWKVGNTVYFTQVFLTPF